MSTTMKMLVSIPVSTYVAGGEKSSINRGVSETEAHERREGAKCGKLMVQARL